MMGSPASLVTLLGGKKKRRKGRKSSVGKVQCVSGSGGGRSQSEMGPDRYISRYWPITDVSGY